MVVDGAGGWIIVVDGINVGEGARVVDGALVVEYIVVDDGALVVDGAFDGEYSLVGVDVSFWIVYDVIFQSDTCGDCQRV